MKEILIPVLCFLGCATLHAARGSGQNGPFTVDTSVAPTVDIEAANLINATGATLGGYASSDGGAAISERGFVYSVTTTNSNPIIDGTGVTKASISGSTGVFTTEVTGLTQGTGYIYKAYAINSRGTSYSAAATFRTLSTNADLSSLTLSSGTLSPTFASSTISYTATVSNATTSMNVTSTRAQANATIEVRVNGSTYAMVASGNPSPALALNVGANSVDVRVLAQDAATQKTYTITISRMAAPPVVITPTASSLTATDATLGGNVTSDGEATITERGVVYSATATNSNPLIGGTGVTKVIISGSTGVFTNAVTGLIQGTNYSFKAYATNSQATSYSTVATFRTLSTNADLSSLTLSSGTLSPAFASSTTAYTATVSNATTSMNVTPTRAQANASIELRINGGTYAMVASGNLSPALALNVGANTLNVRVLAQDASAQKTYTITISRMAAPPVVTTPTASSLTATDATLGGNVTSDGEATVTERGVVYSASATNSNPLIGGTGVTKVIISGSTGVFTTAVTGLTQGNGYSYKAYAINIQGTSYTTVADFTTLSTNADLSDLTLSSGPLSPAFASVTTSYTTNVSNASVSITTVAPMRVHPNATVEVRVNSGSYSLVNSGSPSSALPLNLGTNTVDVRVTAQAGNIKTYTLTVRVNQPPTLSGLSSVAMIEDGQETYAWSLGDVDADPSTLAVVASATTNSALLPLGRISFAGSGAARTVTVDPVEGQSGIATITITVSDSLDSTSATLAVTVYERDIVISQQPQTQEVSEQSEARFSIQLSSGGEFAVYQWFRNNQLLPGATSSELVLPSVLLNQSGNYHVVIASPYDNETSASAPLVVRLFPEIKQQPNSVMVNVGDRTNYSVSAIGRPELTYQWRRNGSDIAGAQSRSFAINTTTMAQAGRYQVRIKNPANPTGVLSAEAELGVVEAQGSLRLMGMPHSKILKLSVVAAGNGLSYQWHLNGSEVTADARIKGWDSKDLTVENISDADNGDYQCRVTGPGVSHGVR